MWMEYEHQNGSDDQHDDEIKVHLRVTDDSAEDTSQQSSETIAAVKADKKCSVCCTVS